jgi:inosose dehydratase
MTLRLATAPVSWGIWEHTIDRDDLVPPVRLLEVAKSMGYGAVESGPPGYLAPNGEAAVELVGPFEVEIVATFLPLRLDDPDAFAEDLALLDQTTEVLAATGDGLVILADAERPERARVSGQPARLLETGWDDATFDLAARHLEIARLRCAERGLRASFHPHAASYVEAPDEIHELLARTPPELGLCLDTGHTIVGGGDPVELARRYADRLVHLHLKDVDATVLGRLRAGEVDMDQAWEQGIFCPFGEGVVPLGEFLALPEVRSLDGYAVLEQDRMAVTIDDLPAVQAIEAENLRRVREWLA